MKKIITSIIRFRNPDFKFDKNVSAYTFFSFTCKLVFSVLRGAKFFLYFKNPQMAMIGKRVDLFNSPKFKFGRFMKLGNDVFISALGVKGVIFGNNVSLGDFSRVIVSTSFNDLGSFISIGNNVGIGEFAYLGGAGGLQVGNDCIIGQYFSCHPENHYAIDLTLLIRKQGVSRKGIIIGNNCWIGSKVTILDGVEIGDGSVVAAGAVVNKSFPPNSIIGGVPAKLIKIRK